MIARCIGNSAPHTKSEAAARNFCANVTIDTVGLTIGQDYTVFGAFFRDGHLWLLVCEEPDDEYPKPHFGEFFELVDDRVPPDWSLCTTENNVGPVALLPTPWARDSRFLERLVDGEQSAVTSFQALKRHLNDWHSGKSKST